MRTETRPIESRGDARIADLCEAFPAIPRSIVIKADVLTQGIQYTRDLEEAGAASFPHSLIWNSRHRYNPHEGPQTALIDFSLEASCR